jgi:4-hydroxybenzoate polyprenyltransferase
VTVLPYNEHVIEFVSTERERGRRTILATASNQLLANKVAQHLALFDQVIASDAGRNCSAVTKRDALVAAHGERGYDYVGNSADDLPVWSAARQAWLTATSPSVEQRARRAGNVAGALEPAGGSLKAWLRALRLHQWLKNLLIFVPLLAAHRYAELPLDIDAALAFAAFCLCASSVYLLNDLLDLADDRHHPRKRSRPFASGQLSIVTGLCLLPLLLVVAFGLAWWGLPAEFSAVLLSYFALTLAYSLTLKRQMILDVITLATLYTLRIVSGAAASQIPLSFWLLAFSMFMFLSLALVKRYAELFDLRQRGSEIQARGRNYQASDLTMVSALGAASGYTAVLVLALYINDVHTTQLYRNKEMIWVACPVLLTWISRIWMLAHRGQMHDDPVIFAMRDRFSLMLIALSALVFWAAT